MRRKLTWEEVKDQYVIANDYVFGDVMDNPDICSTLIQTVLPEIEFDGLVNVVKQSVKDVGPGQKSIRLDIEARDTNGRLYDIEMQNTKQQMYVEKRIRYYGSLIDCDKIKKGEKHENLPQVFIIFICAFDYGQQGRAIYDFSMRDRYDTSREFNDGRRVLLINCDNPISFPAGNYERLAAFVEYVRTNRPTDTFTQMIDCCISEYKKIPEKRRDFAMYMDRTYVYEDIHKADKAKIASLEAKVDDYENRLKAERNEKLKAQERVQMVELELQRLKEEYNIKD